jgi:SAM-dependent methyltransferase
VTRTADPVAASVTAYTDHAATYAARNAGKVAETAARFIAHVPIGGRVLDAGCGPGRDLARFTAAGLTPVGVDLNPAFLAMAAEHAPVEPGDLRRLPFDADSFDGVWACASLVHLPPADAATVLGELRRVTRGGGTVYASVKCSGETGWWDTDVGRRWFQVWSPDVFAAAVEGAGLRVVAVEPGPRFVDVWAVSS